MVKTEVHLLFNVSVTVA